jgi:hypothetical protein
MLYSFDLSQYDSQTFPNFDRFFIFLIYIQDSSDRGSAGRNTATYIQNKSTQTSMIRVGLDTMISVFERAKIFHALDSAVTVIGIPEK